MIDERGMAKTEDRFRQRLEARRETKDRIQKGDVLAANSLTGVEKRLKKMGTPPQAMREIIGRESLRNVVQSNALSAQPMAMEPMQVGLERLLGNNNLIGVSFLERGRRASRAVGCIANRNLSGFGTGFLVSDRLLLTNHHVLPNANVAGRSVVKMDFEVGVDREPRKAVVFKLDPKTFFLNDKLLDFALVAVEPRSADDKTLEPFGRLKLINDDEAVLNGDYVNIIQHPNGEMKQLAMRENEVIDVFEDFAHYETDTAPGSSGSCVCNDYWEVVCLHHSGFPRKNDKDEILTREGEVWKKEMGEQQIDWIANEGIKISSILSFVEESSLASPSEKKMRDDLLASASESGAGPSEDDPGDQDDPDTGEPDTRETGRGDGFSDENVSDRTSPEQAQRETDAGSTMSGEIKIPIEIVVRFKP